MGLQRYGQQSLVKSPEGGWVDADEAEDEINRLKLERDKALLGRAELNEKIGQLQVDLKEMTAAYGKCKADYDEYGRGNKLLQEQVTIACDDNSRLRCREQELEMQTQVLQDEIANLQRTLTAAQAALLEEGRLTANRVRMIESRDETIAGLQANIDRRVAETNDHITETARLRQACDRLGDEAVTSSEKIDYLKDEVDIRLRISTEQADRIECLDKLIVQQGVELVDMKAALDFSRDRYSTVVDELKDVRSLNHRLTRDRDAWEKTSGDLDQKVSVTRAALITGTCFFVLVELVHLIF